MGVTYGTLIGHVLNFFVNQEGGGGNVIGGG